MITHKVELLHNEILGEDVDSLFKGRKILQFNDPIMDQLFDVMHMDIYMFCSLSPHWVSKKFQCALIFTLDDS
jgi:hypothetical protein